MLSAAVKAEGAHAGIGVKLHLVLEENFLPTVYNKRHRASRIYSAVIHCRLIYNSQAWNAVDGTSASLRVIDQPDGAWLVPKFILQLLLGLGGELNNQGILTLPYM